MRYSVATRIPGTVAIQPQRSIKFYTAILFYFIIDIVKSRFVKPKTAKESPDATQATSGPGERPMGKLRLMRKLGFILATVISMLSGSVFAQEVLPRPEPAPLANVGRTPANLPSRNGPRPRKRRLTPPIS